MTSGFHFLKQKKRAAHTARFKFPIIIKVFGTAEGHFSDPEAILNWGDSREAHTFKPFRRSSQWSSKLSSGTKTPKTSHAASSFKAPLVFPFFVFDRSPIHCKEACFSSIPAKLKRLWDWHRPQWPSYGTDKKRSTIIQILRNWYYVRAKPDSKKSIWPASTGDPFPLWIVSDKFQGTCSSIKCFSTWIISTCVKAMTPPKKWICAIVGNPAVKPNFPSQIPKKLVCLIPAKIHIEFRISSAMIRTVTNANCLYKGVFRFPRPILHLKE